MFAPLSLSWYGEICVCNVHLLSFSTDLVLSLLCSSYSPLRIHSLIHLRTHIFSWLTGFIIHDEGGGPAGPGSVASRG